MLIHEVNRHRLQRLENTAVILGVLTLILALAPPALAAKKMKHTVSGADLSQLDEEVLWVLRDKQADVANTETAHEGSKVAIDEAKEELKLSKEACAKRYLTANQPRWSNIGAEPFPIFVIKMNLIPCRDCALGAEMAKSLEEIAA